MSAGATQDVLNTIRALDIAVDSLAAIADMDDGGRCGEEAMNVLREINGLLVGDPSEAYRVPSVRPASMDRIGAIPLAEIEAFDRVITGQQASDRELRTR
jgi:hypothetical protein